METNIWTAAQWLSVLFFDESEVQFVFHLEIKVPESGGRVEKDKIHADLRPV